VADHPPARYGAAPDSSWWTGVVSPWAAIAVGAVAASFLIGGPWLVWFAGGLIGGVSLSGST